MAFVAGGIFPRVSSLKRACRSFSVKIGISSD